MYWRRKFEIIKDSKVLGYVLCSWKNRNSEFYAEILSKKKIMNIVAKNSTEMYDCIDNNLAEIFRDRVLYR